MTFTAKKLGVPPIKITRLLHGGWPIQIIKTAVETDLFGALENGPLTAEDLSLRAKLNKDATALLLDALVALELLDKRSGLYDLVEASRLYLVPSSPLFIGRYLERQEEIARAWSQLTQVIRSGEPVARVNTDKEAEEFFPALAAAIFPMHFTTAEMVSRELEVSKLPASASILDLAAGSGVWSIPMARDNAAVTVYALDFPPILEVTREFADRFAVLKQYKWLPGNWRDVALDDQSFDVIILGHILHCEGRRLSEELLAKCFKALKKKGWLVIGEFLANNDRTAPAFPLMFALNMRLLTTDGCVFSEGELLQLLAKLGYADAHRLDLPHFGNESPVVLAKKPG